MHICVFLCSYIVMCISVFVYLNIRIFPRVLRHECTHPECPLLNLFPGAPIFPPPRRAFFNPRFLPQMNENCSQSAKVHKYTNANTKIHRCKYTNTQNANTFFSRQMNENCHQSTKVHYSGALQPFWGIELQTAPFCYSLWRKITKKGIFVLVNNIT